MTLIEAIKSGKRFRQPGWTFWLTTNMYGTIYIDKRRESTGHYELTADQILATNWEVEEKKVEVTASQVILAYQRARGYHPTVQDDTLSRLLKELGLEE